MRKINHLSKRDIGGRSEQQDSVVIVQDGNDLLISLADGMGGHSGGARASSIFTNISQVYFENKSYENPQIFFQDIITHSEEEIKFYAKQSGEDPHTTATLALIKDEYIHFANIGDSRVYIFDRVELQKRTRDHSVPEMLLQMGEITEEQIATHPDQNKLTKSLGPNSNEMPNYYSYKLNKNKDYIILLCSDGFWEYVEEQEMIHFIFGSELNIALNNMVQIAKKRGGNYGDNISVAVATLMCQKQKKELTKSFIKIEKTEKRRRIKNKYNYIKLFYILLIIFMIIIGIAFYQKIDTNNKILKDKLNIINVELNTTKKTMIKNQLENIKDILEKIDIKLDNNITFDSNQTIRDIDNTKKVLLSSKKELEKVKYLEDYIIKIEEKIRKKNNLELSKREEINDKM